jgi:intracellular sulfur oxidation DsrE/DsrF family protein
VPGESGFDERQRTMKPIQCMTLLGSILAVSAPVLAANDPPQDFWQTPALVGVGKIHPLPHAAYQPQPGETYSVVFSITKAADTPTETNSALQHVARAVNLYASAGVPSSHLKFVAVIYGQAIDTVLDDEHYRQKYGVDNPNLALIRTLHTAGIDVVACGQAIAEHHEQYQWIAPQVTLALSGLTTITTLEHRGYVLMPL